jgi:serine/threonine protein kinase
MMVPQPTLEPLRQWDPDRIGPFTLLGRLGAGAMGQVYLGRSQAGRQVAVKTIKIELAEEPGFRDHFAHEVAAARRVSGMFTAAVVAADADADVPWLATAYVPAPSLRRLVRSCGPQPVETIWWLAAGCAEALESIHGAGLVHRDLKPSNVLVAPDGPRVIDFGVARAAERIALTVTRGAVGTPAYMAPEQARDTRQASMASDVFALGATLLFAATGHPPYQGETVMDVLVRLATEPPDLTGLPAELTDLITECLRRSPRDRPTSAALLARLGPLVAGGGEARAYLTDPAMSVIRSYQRGPALTALRPARAGANGSAGGGRAADSTPGSQPSTPGTSGSSGGMSSPGDLAAWDAADGEWASVIDPGEVSVPGDESEAGDRSAPGDASEPGAGSEPGAASEAGTEDAATYGSHLALPAVPAGRGRRHEAVFGLAGRSAAAVLLIGAGVLIGSLLIGSHNSGGTSGQGSGSPAGQGFSPPPGGPGGPPPSNFPSTAPGVPAVVMLQPAGDPYSGYVVHGTGWGAAGSTVTITLAGRPGHVARAFVDRQGSFNYIIDQGNAFFSGPMPPGVYQVIVTGKAGARATVRFQVLRLPPPKPTASASPSA